MILRTFALKSKEEPNLEGDVVRDSFVWLENEGLSMRQFTNRHRLSRIWRQVKLQFAREMNDYLNIGDVSRSLFKNLEQRVF